MYFYDYDLYFISLYLFISLFFRGNMYDPPQRTPQMAEARCFAPRNDPSKPTGHEVGAVRPPRLTAHSVYEKYPLNDPSTNVLSVPHFVIMSTI